MEGETTIDKLHGGRDIHREMKKRRVKATVEEIKRIKRDYFLSILSQILAILTVCIMNIQLVTHKG